VPQVFTRSYAWFNLAAAAGSDAARTEHDAILERMPPG
jgi:hypothetical protein